MHGIELAKQFAWCVLVDQGYNFESARTELPHFYSGSRGVESDRVMSKLRCNLSSLHNPTVLDNYQSQFLTWVNQSKRTSAKGLDKFEPDFSAGVTQAIDSFLLRVRNKTVCFFEGEYYYAPVLCNRLGIKYKYIKDASRLHPGDAVILSYPFADTGSEHSKTEQLLNMCDEFGIPVMIDACYWMLGRDLEFDFNRHCIKSVAFSFSKAFPVAHARVGVRYTRPGWEDGQTLHKDINYNNRLSADIGLQLMQNFSCDYLIDLYEERYIRLCKLFELHKENSILFATGDSSWSEYSRVTLAKSYGITDKQSYNNRIFLGRLLESPIIDRLLDEYTS